MRQIYLAVVMIVMAVLRAGAGSFTVGGVTYSTSGGVATVTGASNKSITKLTIPATVTYGGATYPVNFISGNAFWGYNSLRELVIEDSDTYIGSKRYNARFGDPFKGCPIEKAYVGRNLALKSGAGYQEDLTPISSSALMDLTIAGKATFITTGMTNGLTFMDNTSVKTLTIGGDVTQVNNYAFNGCSNLRKVTILPGDTTISFSSDNIFTGCPIDSLIVGRDIAKSSKCGGAQMHTVVITDDISNLSENMFSYCSSLKYVVMSDSKEMLSTSSVYNNMFNGCVLDSVYIGRPYTVSSMFPGAKVKKVIYGPLMERVESLSFLNHKELEQVVFTDNITEIGENAFNGCTSLTEVRLPQSLKVIGRNAFSGCSSLERADLTPNIDTIGSGAFRSTGLKAVTIPKSVKSLGENVFNNCSSLKYVVMSDSKEMLSTSSVYNNMFNGCVLDSVYIGRPYTVSSMFPGAKVKKVIYGPLMERVESLSFLNHKELEQVVFTDNITEIGENAFNGCTSLTEVRLPQSLKVIGRNAFSGCSSLERADLTPNIDTIGSGAFRSTGLKTVTIPKSVKSIDGAVYDYLSLESFIIEDGENELTLGVDYKHPICKSGSIDSVYIGRNLTNPTYLLGECRVVRKIEVGEMVAEIETLLGSDIYSCRKTLKYVGLPSTLVKLGDAVFSGCYNIDSIHIAAKLPPVCTSTRLFDNQVYSDATLIVPAGSKRAYREAEVWKLFKNIQSEGGGFKVTVRADTAYGEVLLNGSNLSEITVDEDEPLTVGFSTVEGYSISKVTVNGVDVTSLIVDGMLRYESIDSNMEIDVTFSIITFKLSVPADLTGGHILVNGDDVVSSTVNYGSRLEISVVPHKGYTLKSMTVSGVDVTTSLTENQTYIINRVTSDVVVQAVFEPIVYTVSAVATTDYGTLTLNGIAGDCRVAFGSPVVIGVTPAHEGCYLESLTVDGTDVTAFVENGVYTIESVESDIAVEAVFGIRMYAVDFVFDSERGYIYSDLFGSDTSGSVAHGSKLLLVIRPAEGFEIESVLLDGVDVTSHLTDNGELVIESVKGPHRVEAVFAVRRLRLNILGLEGGKLAMRYDYGSPVTMFVEPADGWKFHSITVDDDVVTVLDYDNSYTIPSLTDDATVSVVFQLDHPVGIETLTHNITVSAHQRTITIIGASEGEMVEIYDTSGLHLYHGSEHVINLNRQGIFIVCVASRTFKVMLE